MAFLNWCCFILICLDTASYIIEKVQVIENIAGLFGLLVGIAARLYVLYNTATCWLLA